MCLGLNGENPERGGLGVPELNAHIRQTHQGRVSGDTANSTYGINNLVGGWGAAFCLTTTRLEGSSGALYCLEQWLTHTFV
jgi:hypothetical protein